MTGFQFEQQYEENDEEGIAHLTSIGASTTEETTHVTSVDTSTFNPARLNAEWATLSAIREMLGIALKGRSEPTYDQARDFGNILAPELFNSESTILGRGKERQIIQEYRQRADAQSQLEKRQVAPAEIVDVEIQQFEKLLHTGGNRNLIKRRLGILHAIRRMLQPKEYTENQLILRDLFKTTRDLPVPPIDKDSYREYQLTEDRGLRIRLLHPDPPEHSIGADLIYEHYWDKKKKARLALVQYKIWDGKTLYLSQAANLDNQMTKLTATFCDSGLCGPWPRSARTDAYRLPYCAVFLRPTDKLQDPDSQLISSGLHVPICVVRRVLQDTNRGNKKIESKNIRSESLSHKIFEEMFNANMLGSRWLNYDEVENLYRTHGILEPTERIVIHAQEFGLD